MRPPERIPETLEALRAYWEKHPDLRLGQIVSNFAALYANNQDPFFIEDDVVLYGLKQLR